MLARRPHLRPFCLRPVVVVASASFLCPPVERPPPLSLGDCCCGDDTAWVGSAVGVFRDAGGTGKTNAAAPKTTGVCVCVCVECLRSDSRLQRHIWLEAAPQSSAFGLDMVSHRHGAQRCQQTSRMRGSTRSILRRASPPLAGGCSLARNISAVLGGSRASHRNNSEHMLHSGRHALTSAQTIRTSPASCSQTLCRSSGKLVVQEWRVAPNRSSMECTRCDVADQAVPPKRRIFGESSPQIVDREVFGCVAEIAQK